MHVLLSNYSLHVLVGWGYCVPGPVLKPVFGPFFEIPERMVAVLVSVVSCYHSRPLLLRLSAAIVALLEISGELFTLL